ncbi:MAG TPA: SDR family oxidoreductase [Flavobacteriales bacterium]|nr:SDR family oxidoreductase [Flavobacteriales bacterium]
MKTALITGANKGIGFETARQLGQRDFHVIITGRDEKKLEKALNILENEKGSYEYLVMDVSNTLSIAHAVLKFKESHHYLDVLINNAGILLKNDESLARQEEKILQETLQTNCYGALNVTKVFLPFMRSGARIINVSSGGGSMSDPVGGWAPAYCVSKSTLNALTRHLAYELAPQQISVNAVCPGWVKTDMGGGGATRMVSKGAETPVWLAAEADQTLTGKFFRDKKEIDW